MKLFFRTLLGLMLVTTLALFIGCSDDDDSGPTQPQPQSAFDQMATAGDAYLTAGTKNITAADLWTQMNDADTTQPYVISVRSLRDDTVRGHIPGAVHWDFTSLTNTANHSMLPANKKIVVYCYTGQTASFATSYLNMVGFDAYNLKWGICSWTADTAITGANGGWYTLQRGGQALETTANPLTTEHAFPNPTCNATDVVGMISERCSAYFTAGFKMKSASEVYANINDGDATNDWFLLNYWPEANYNAGHIPGSFRFQPGTLGKDENLKYLPTDKPIIVWCFTGHTSAQVCMYLSMLGYDAYSMRYGANAITDRDDMLGANEWVDLTPTYPISTGPIVSH